MRKKDSSEMRRADSRAHLLHVFPSFAIGGQQIRFVALAAALHDKYRHTVVAMDADYSAGKLLGRDVACSFAEIPVVKSRGVSFANVRNARSILRESRPDLLLTYNWGTIEWSLANLFFPYCPQLHLEDGFGPDESLTTQVRRRALSRRLLLSRCKSVIVPSGTLLTVATDIWRLPRNRVTHIPNGIECDRFDRPPDPELLSNFRIPHSAPIVGTVAALRPEKNLMRLLRVFAAVARETQASLVIVGDGPLRQALTDEAARLGLGDRVIMTGMLPNPEKIISRFDVFALTSDTEQMPNAVIEAMAAGIAVVATDVGDVKRMLAKENAPFVTRCDDESGLIERLRALLRDRELRRSIGRRNKGRVRDNFGFDAMLSRHDALISSLVRS